MATLDWRTLAEKDKGGSITLFGFTEAQIQAALRDATSTATWISLGFEKETGGTVGFDIQSNAEYTENGVRDDVETLDEATLGIGLLQTRRRQILLVRYMMRHEVVAKKILPLREPTAEGATHQIWAYPKFKLTPQALSIPTGRNETRSADVVGRGFKADPTDVTEDPVLVYEVDLADETSWPAELDPFKEAAFGGV